MCPFHGRPFDPQIPPTVYVRTQEHADWDRETGCLVSRYSVGSHGYAQVGWQEGGDRTVLLAHRAAWESTFGPIADGMTVDHLCRNRRCVNVAHMRLLSNFENARRTSGRDWPLGQCINGHPNSMLIVRGGKRMCGECSRTWGAKKKAGQQLAQAEREAA